ncbi:AraC family transcriptional regulator [Roseimicrobium sp. ORNL1]|uniref:PAS domain-containing protein n=1 Tax=Roseimicrobium sp. ORNL1 TaxID=2711231 RepID=UPI0013E15E15|nr:AraC family transcriptional regulator [Roseimicrobium sp. ORNL1]QIF01140.1 PAS domain-containing protein [Roseimicrobium sp. ORNL1]
MASDSPDSASQRADSTRAAESTRRPTAEETLERVERLARIGSWSWDIAANQTQWSGMMYEMFQWDSSKPAPRFEELGATLTAESQLAFATAVERCTREGEPFSLDLEALRGDGSHFSIQVNAQSSRDGGDRVIGVFGTVQDITEQKRSERALRESEARWQFALDGAGDGVWDWNVPAKSVYFSHHWKAMLGYADDEVGSSLEDWSDKVHPDDLARCWTEIQRHFSGEVPMYLCEHRMRAKDGTWRWILDRGKIVSRTDDGSPLTVIGTHTDITRLKGTEQALRDSEGKIRLLHERLQLAIKAGQVGIWEVDLVTSKFFYNEQMHEIYGVGEGCFRDGIPVNTFGGHKTDWYAAVHPDDRAHVAGTLELAKRTEGVTEYEHRIVRPSGEVRHVKSSALFLRDEDGVPVQGIGTTLDVTEERLLTESIARERERMLLATQASSIGVWEYDFQTRLFIWDEKMHALYDPEPGIFDYTLEGWRNMIHLEDAERVMQEWQASVEKGTQFECEFRVEHRAGEIRSIRALAQILYSPDGAPVRAVGTNWDVTEEKQPAASSKKSPASPAAQPIPVGSLTARKLAMVLAYIDQNISEPLTLEMMAQVASISASHFSDLFRQCMGQSPHQYLMARRVEKAKDLLASTDHSIAEVAASVGFADQSHLTRLMRRFTGLTPRMLRGAEVQ